MNLHVYISSMSDFKNASFMLYFFMISAPLDLLVFVVLRPDALCPIVGERHFGLGIVLVVSHSVHLSLVTPGHCISRAAI